MGKGREGEALQEGRICYMKLRGDRRPCYLDTRHQVMPSYFVLVYTCTDYRMITFALLLSISYLIVIRQNVLLSHISEVFRMLRKII